ncbi:MAG: hypothetical protein JST30_15155 [Armatimonadetes bacterium]|nr:hypothetical protein [Armatimonadota bacterium]
MPVRLSLQDHGSNLPFKGRGGGDIVPTFDASGSRAFPTDYKTYLQDVFTAAKPAMNAVFGLPAVGGTVRVRNYDADIQDRYAVGGGYYIWNGPNGPEVRFPVYNNRVSTAINYIHTLLLAYMADKQYPWDAYNEGLVRAATIAVCRTPGSIPGNPDKAQIEDSLSALYDVGPLYDWYNRPSLGGPKFIAGNLLDEDLPIGGSTGGVFLLRYLMAGTAWSKVAIRYPGFIAEFNKRFYANPAAYQTTLALETLGQTVLDFLTGTSGTTIEGLTFAKWAAKQAILDTRISPGLKVQPSPIPIPAEAGSPDFGVFDIVVNVFETKASGDEILLAGTAYPVYWRPDFSRFFGSVQDDTIRIAGAYGSVTPNFSKETFQGAVYRVVVDVPFFGKTARSFLPAGAYSTGTQTEPNTFYGTLAGFAANTYTVNVAWTGGSKNAIAVSNNAFGVNIQDDGFLKSGPVTVRVQQGATEVLRREVVKSEGPLALELVPASSDQNYTLVRPGRLDMVSLPIEPFRLNAADILGLADGQTLFGRWNSNVAKYAMYPAEGEFRQGLGYWVRPPSAANQVVFGRSIPGVPVAVSLSPGWNQVSVPFTTAMSTSNVLVTVADEAVGTYDDAVADGTLGTTIYRFEPDTVDKDAGSMIPATTFTPGKAYFVRANRPEGAVLVFAPSGSTRDGQHRSGDRPQYRIAWETEIKLIDERQKTCRIAIGQAAGARRIFDRALDSDLPPLVGGYQLAVVNGMYLDRDMRPTGTTERYSLLVSGLVPGRKYVLRFRPSTQSPNLRLTDGYRTMLVSSNQDYLFTADAKSKRITLDTGGGW